jgi:hypothetical protein
VGICFVYISFFVRVMILEGHYVIISELGTCVCIYVTVQELHFLIIFCASYKSVNKQVCVIASMYMRVHSCVYMCESFMRVYVCVIHAYMCVSFMPCICGCMCV